MDLPTNIVNTGTGAAELKTGLNKIAGDVANAGAYIALPFGGGQGKKVLQGIRTVNAGGEYVTQNSGDKYLRYPVAQTLENYVKAAVLGKSTLPETNQYYDNKRKALSVEQTKIYDYAVKNGLNPQQVYNQYLTLRDLKPLPKNKGVTDQQKKDSIKSNINLTPQQRQLLIDLMVDEKKRKKLLGEN